MSWNCTSTFYRIYPSGSSENTARSLMAHFPPRALFLEAAATLTAFSRNSSLRTAHLTSAMFYERLGLWSQVPPRCSSLFVRPTSMLILISMFAGCLWWT
ncbi:hypothetical protein BDN71DRAFT_928678 [Pleurotus eryngii]|uniref:Uncharacterized protein n=1 Tax=Pleurotus eryngii TaxID=5323 RepID=A0A9P5ZYX3_PLEER|nr:hypothetical protein BDN71DRAFT_928678 [Pleurotus eryngii]